ncbi:beta-galactosidase-1-like protein 2 [Ylistrum balloti]|uniref:beta-galactosidase-1-like protein 2 n=1 Tax=Ylistrum balloti TaxID=509963 RepID=UPI002905C608|nr:beta-galactosidase-1-like protein 2 [Ylistrum balloti]
MWPWEWRDTLKRRKDGYGRVNTEDDTYESKQHKIQTKSFLRNNKIKGLAAILVIAAVVVFFGWPRGGFKGEVPDVSHVTHRYKSHGSLTFKKGEFYLDTNPIKIVSGTMHYYRVVPSYWEERMKKMKACGLNTLQTSIPWNLHNQNKHSYFTEVSSFFLYYSEYLETAKKVGLHVIIVPGPYVGSDLELGGLPSWLLRDPDMEVRTNYDGYLSAVKRYFTYLMSIIEQKQHSKGGPIIAVQIEHQYGSFSKDTKHLQVLKKMMVQLGVTEMVLTSDGWTDDNKLGMAVAPFHDSALPTASFSSFEEGKSAFDHITSLSTDFPLFVSNFWTGANNYWGDKYSPGSTVTEFTSNLEEVLITGASINFYMFHGGTNIDVIAGASDHNGYQPGVTSYDYDAPLTEWGDTTLKYKAITELLLKYDYIRPEDIVIPEISRDPRTTAYGSVQIQAFLSFENMLSRVKGMQRSRFSLTMEELNVRGQRSGYILYRTNIPSSSIVRLTDQPRDRLQLLVNGINMDTIFDWNTNTRTTDISSECIFINNTLDLLVENTGRVSEVKQSSDWMDKQRKGLHGDVLVDRHTVNHWTIYSLDFSSSFINRIKTFDRWKPFTSSSLVPGLYRTELSIEQSPTDTFLSLTGWEKGMVFVNGNNVGRYWNVGPQHSLYVPAYYLKRGMNLILIFEQHKVGATIFFSDKPSIGKRMASEKY